jgi:hypothetical protein
MDKHLHSAAATLPMLAASIQLTAALCGSGFDQKPSLSSASHMQSPDCRDAAKKKGPGTAEGIASADPDPDWPFRNPNWPW